jgi:hypothetical protein
LGQERLEAIFHRSEQNRALRVEPDLQAKNLVQIKTEHSQPVDETISGPLAQGHNLTNVGRDALSQLVEKTCGNEIWRSASVAAASGGGNLSDGVAVAVQNISEALGSSSPVTRLLSIFAGFDPAKRVPCARYLEPTRDRCRRVHSSILARLLALSAQAGATSFGAPLLPRRRPLCNVVCLPLAPRGEPSHVRTSPPFDKAIFEPRLFHDGNFSANQTVAVTIALVLMRRPRHHNQQGSTNIQDAE